MLIYYLSIFRKRLYKTYFYDEILAVYYFKIINNLRNRTFKIVFLGITSKYS